MKIKFLPILSFLCIFLSACQENEQPDLIYGEYSIVSMVSSEPMDITGAGDISDDFWKQIQSSGYDFAKFPRLNLYSPAYFNVSFAQIVFYLPQHLESTRGIDIELNTSGRKFEKQPDESMTLGWNTHIYPGSPYQLWENVLIKQINFESRNLIIHLEVVQDWYDHLLGEWKEAIISYRFKKRF